MYLPSGMISPSLSISTKAIFRNLYVSNFGIHPKIWAEDLGQVAEVLAINLAIQRAKTRNMQGVSCMALEVKCGFNLKEDQQVRRSHVIYALL